MVMENLEQLVRNLCALPGETEWLEFKKDNASSEMIGKSISALANGATMAGRSCSYLVWGVDDQKHTIVGTRVHFRSLKKGNEELESWLYHQLSDHVHFEIYICDIDGKHIEFLRIQRARYHPITFEGDAYIRVGSYTKRLSEELGLYKKLWETLRSDAFEDEHASIDLRLEEVRSLLDSDACFTGFGLPIPSNEDEYVRSMRRLNLIIAQDNGLYTITNLGAILFAKDLSEFGRLERKAVRIVQYQGNDRMSMLKEETITQGYALAFDSIVKLVSTLLPTRENLSSVRRAIDSPYSLVAIREAIANALIHQDFLQTGFGPLIELFTDRLEVTNSGLPLVELDRIVDTPPLSRNEILAGHMRKLALCEELGRGWDRMVLQCEKQNLPAPIIQLFNSNATRVTLFAHRDFHSLSQEDRLRATYLHAVVRYIEGDSLTNTSLRERFALDATSASRISRLIGDAVAKNLIKLVDPTTAKRHMRYVPYWA